MAGGTTTPSMSKGLSEEALRRLIDQSVIQGIVGACALFLQKRNVAYCDKSLMCYAGEISREFSNNKPVGSPLPDSILLPIQAALQESYRVINALNEAGEHENLIKIIRVITSGELMIVLDKHAGAAIELFKSCEKQNLSGGEAK